MESENQQEDAIKVEDLLAKAEPEKKKYKSIEVSKEVDPVLDVGSLLLSDLQPINITEIRNNLKGSLDQLARDNCQLLFNEIWKLPVERIEDAIVAKLPPATTALPREKPIPKPKPPTKWEKFAKEKGINKKKRGRMVWDEQAQDWKPRYGYKRVDDVKDKWLIEVPDNADPYEDQFDKKAKEKKERVAKNELQRLRNIARNQKAGKGDIMSLEFKPAVNKDKDRLSKEIDIAKTSTASVGKFQARLPKEKEGKSKGQKRKFESVAGNASDEKKRALEVWDRLHKPPPVDMTKAVNKYSAESERHLRSEDDDHKAKRGKGKKSSKKHGKPFQAKKRGKEFKGKKGRPGGGAKGKPMGKRK